MVPPRFAIPHAHSPNVVANAGIDLLILPDRRVEFSPRQFLSCDPSSRPMPMVTAAVVNRCCRLLRRIWHLSGCSASWLLYVDLVGINLVPYLPPQMCSPLDVRLNCTFPGCTPPSSHLRLAGSITSCPLLDPVELAGRVPVFDGIHLFIVPQLWMPLLAFVVVGGVSHLIPPGYAVCEDEAPEDLSLAQRLYLIDRLP